MVFEFITFTCVEEIKIEICVCVCVCVFVCVCVCMCVCVCEFGSINGSFAWIHFRADAYKNTTKEYTFQWQFEGSCMVGEW